MKVVCISDTHRRHREIKNIPYGDVLICCGDITIHNEIQVLIDFNRWLGELPHKHKIVIAGNHDGMFYEDFYNSSYLMTNATYLQDSDIVIDGIKFYGTPWVKTYGSYYFGLDTKEELARKWSFIPDDVDVLITHTPPYGVMDVNRKGINCGCEELAYALLRIKPQYHVFGHIHEGRGKARFHGINMINAAINKKNMDLSLNDPLTFTIKEAKNERETPNTKDVC